MSDDEAFPNEIEREGKSTFTIQMEENRGSTRYATSSDGNTLRRVRVAVMPELCGLADEKRGKKLPLPPRSPFFLLELDKGGYGSRLPIGYSDSPTSMDFPLTIIAVKRQKRRASEAAFESHYIFELLFRASIHRRSSPQSKINTPASICHFRNYLNLKILNLISVIEMLSWWMV